MQLILGDCLEKLKELPDNSVDTIITDPPYGLKFMGKEWDYDVPSVEIWKEALRVLKPGGTALIFAGSRTQHRMAVNVEDAGFILKDTIMWLYGSGFPKSLNIGKVMDKYLKTGNASWNGTGDSSNGALGYSKLQHNQGYRPADYSNKHQNKEEITEDLAKKWNGWGTALKPAYEPILVAMKPNDGSYAENALKWGVSGLNIDESRVGFDMNSKGDLHAIDQWERQAKSGVKVFNQEGNAKLQKFSQKAPIGRYPANVIHDGSKEVLERFPDNKGAFSPVKSGQKGFGGVIYGKYSQAGDDGKTFYGDGLGSASRFFYCAKASRKERNMGLERFEKKQTWASQEKRESNSFDIFESDGRPKTINQNNHPTIKPLKLMEYLCVLTKTPTGGTVLDPFMGSGTTGMACVNTGRDFIGIEIDEDYFKIAQARIESCKESRQLTFE